MNVLHRLLLINYQEEEDRIQNLVDRNINLKVPRENNKTTLHYFNCELSDLHAEAEHYYGLARRNKDAIERIIDNVLKDFYNGKNELARKAAGIQFAQKYPIPEELISFLSSDSIDLFYLEDLINGIYYVLNSLIKSLEAKASAKITSNSLLNLERSLIV